MSSTAANFGFKFGTHASSRDCGLNAAPAFGDANVSRSNLSSGPLWQDNASEPFGRVESTAQCFARNGEAATVSRWTPPKPPIRPLFQSHSTARDTVPLFGHSTQPQLSSTLFATCNTNPPFCGDGGFSFGDGDTATSRTNTNSSSAFGTGFAQNTTGSLFGGMASGTVFESTSRVGLNEKVDSNQTNLFATGFGGTRTVFGSGSSTAKPPLAPSSKPFTTSTNNPFEMKSAPVSTSNPFFTLTPQASSSNATLSNVPSITANPFAMKASSTDSVNPFAVKVPSKVTVRQFSIQDESGSNVVAVSGSAAGSGSASRKFKIGLRPAFKSTASFRETGWQQRQPLVQTQPPSRQSFDWTGWENKKESTLPKVGHSFTMPRVSSSEMKNLFDSTSSMTPTSFQTDALVASGDKNPYGSGSFGAGIIEEKIKTAIANKPSSVELKVLDDRSPATSICLTSRQQPSARVAARLGLARQPLRALPMLPVHSRYPSRRLHTVPSDTRAKLIQANPFCFSSSFSRHVISKKPLRIRVKPSPVPVNTTADEVGEVRSAGTQNDDKSSRVGRDSDDESTEEANDSLVPACPVLFNEEYFTEPSASELQQLNEEELSSVKNFVIGRRSCGKISFIDATDVRGLHLDKLVAFSEGKVVVYPDDRAKPAIGSALNKPAIVELDGISAEENEMQEDFLQRLKNHTQALGATFLGYDENSKNGSGGVWSFRVEHF